MSSVKRGLISVAVVLSVVSIILLVSMFAILLAPSAFAAQGCFTEPSYVRSMGSCSSVDEIEVLQLCEGKALCISDFFFKDKSCSQVPICEEKTGWCLDSCTQVQSAAHCTNRATFTEIAEQPLECRQGCCVCDKEPANPTDNVCDVKNPFKRQSECSTFCKGLQGYHVGLFDPFLSPEQCTGVQGACATFAAAPAQASGHILNAMGNGIGGVTVSAAGQSTTTNALGLYELKSLPQGEVVFSAQKQGFKTADIQVALASGEKKEGVDIILIPSATGTGSIKGTVKDSQGMAISGAQVTLRGATLMQIVTGGDGTFSFTGLLFGSYTVEVNADGFQVKKESTSLSEQKQDALVHIVVVPVPVGTIRGRVTDESGTPLVAQILLDSTFMLQSTSNGFYSLSVPAEATGKRYSISAAKAGFASAPPQDVLVHTGDVNVVDFVLLVSLTAECAFPQSKPVTELEASHILGEPGVKLTWKKPCPQVRGYIINRSSIRGDGSEKSSEMAFIDAAQGQPTSYTDRDAEWGSSYAYDVSAVYTDARLRQSEKEEARITTGNERCEGKFTDGQPQEFCEALCTSLIDTLSGGDKKEECMGSKLRKSCDERNQIVDAPGELTDCSILGDAYFCTGPDARGKTSCRNEGICSSTEQKANPFGLWFTQDFCYGGKGESDVIFQNYCVFDRSATIFNACRPCATIKTCFDYKSEDACRTNNCAAAGVAGCQWVTASHGLGTGYCVPRGYNNTDHCSDCSAHSSLFRNALCTTEICTGLGGCFARVDQRACRACDASSTCYGFSTEFECTGKRNARFSFGTFIPSDDACGLERCRWGAAENVCIKDGDGNAKDDCSSFIGGIEASCKKDNKAPVTKVRPRVLLVNEKSGTAIFSASDSNTVKKLYYCIDRTNTCLPTEAVNYPRGGIFSLDLASQDNANLFYGGQGTYFLRYFSEDAFFNRENVQSISFIADRDTPSVLLLAINVTPRTQTSVVNISIAINETVLCTDRLISYNTHESLNNLKDTYNDTFTVTYTDVPDGLYRYELNCSDAVGNMVFNVTDLIDADAVQSISIVSPPRALTETSFSFVVRTSDESVCALYDGVTRVEAMSSSNSVEHSSKSRSFVPNIFYSNWNVKCRDVATQKVREKIIPFTIDRSPPRTSVKLSTPDGPAGLYPQKDWTARLPGSAAIQFLCQDGPPNGFGCSQTMYCISPDQDCVPSQTGTVPVVRENSRVCYFSMDGGGSQEEVKCGTITILSDFGITLVKPLYGYSDSPIFDLAVSTIVPSDTCKWAAADFNFATLLRKPNFFARMHPFLFDINEFTRLVPGFPTAGNPTMLVSIKCNATSGRISPTNIFEIGWDPSPPVIISAAAEPALVIEGNTVDLVVQTDELTLCKYGIAPNYQTMPGKFPDHSAAVFHTDHRKTLTLSGSDDGKVFNYNVSCMNRAGNFSSVKGISFMVDFSISGAITRKEPKGIIGSTSVELLAETNRKATCVFADSGMYKSFESSGDMKHTKQQSGLQDGLHSYPVRCVFTESGEIRTDSIDFIIDTEPPTPASIFDGNFNCGLTSISPRFEAHDSNSRVAGYSYQLVEKQDGRIVTNGTTASAAPLLSATLTNGTAYVIRMKPIDEAGNVGAEFVSDGFIALSPLEPQCNEKGPPKIDIIKNVTRTGVSVTLICEDESGCSVMRNGLADSQAACAAINLYSGPVLVSKPQTFCAFVLDGVGNNATAVEQIAVPDEDVDGVTDPFDECTETPVGETPNAEGCSASQLVVNPPFGISLVSPRYGYSDSPIFDLNISTKVAGDTCKWAAGGFDFVSLLNKNNFFLPKNDKEAENPPKVEGAHAFEISEFTERIPDFPTPENPVMQVSVRCNSTRRSSVVAGRISQPQAFEIGWDPSPPVIVSVAAEPALVMEGNTVDIVAETDEPTLCRYGVAPDHEAMQGTFSDHSLALFNTTHRKTLALTSSDHDKTFAYNVSCMNRAGNFSSLKELSFSVDFSVGGAITAEKPSGILTSANIDLLAETNRKATCSFSTTGAFQPFESLSGTKHTKQQSNMQSGVHSYPIRCLFTESGAVRTGKIEFTVDLLPPVPISISDGNITCDLQSVNPRFEAIDNQSRVASYIYELVEKQGGRIITNGTTTSSTPQLSVNLTDGKDYVFRMKPVDAAGNTGIEMVSDGFIALSPDTLRCKERGPPQITLGAEITRTGVSVDLICEDETGCPVTRYGLGADQTGCTAINLYSGPVLVSKPQTFCAFVLDGVGNNATAVEHIAVPDEDVDGVTDPFDECTETPVGETPNAEGCSASQLIVDSDSDGLPDSWEVENNLDYCQFDPNDGDSDDDSVSDGDEDYDGDGKSNFGEYTSKTEPCSVSDSDNDGVPDAPDKCDKTPPKEVSDIIKDPFDASYGCGPSERDTDKDGMSDAFEWKYCGGDCDPQADLDLDGLVNVLEFQLETDPTRADTDGDGWTDGAEFQAKTDPLDPSSMPAAAVSELEGASVLGVGFLATGLLFVLSGGGYLAYGHFRPRKVLLKAPTAAMPSAARAPVAAELKAKAKAAEEERARIHILLEQRKKERTRLQEHKREEVFRTFGAEAGRQASSKQAPTQVSVRMERPAQLTVNLPLPGLARVISKDKPVFEKLARVTEKYTKKKSEFDEKLSPKEKQVFEKLESIGKGAQGKELREVLGQHKDTAKLFDELSSIVKEHETQPPAASVREGGNVFERLKKYVKK